MKTFLQKIKKEDFEKILLKTQKQKCRGVILISDKKQEITNIEYDLKENCISFQCVVTVDLDIINASLFLNNEVYGVSLFGIKKNNQEYKGKLSPEVFKINRRSSFRLNLKKQIDVAIYLDTQLQGVARLNNLSLDGLSLVLKENKLFNNVKFNFEGLTIESFIEVKNVKNNDYGCEFKTVDDSLKEQIFQKINNYIKNNN